MEDEIVDAAGGDTPAARLEAAQTVVEQRYAELFEHTLLGICISTPSGSLTACNPAFARMLGFASIEDVIGADMGSFYADAEGRQHFLGELHRKRRLEYYRTTMRRRDGSLLHIITSVVGHFDPAGTLQEIHGYILDDSASVEAGRALREREQLFHAVFFDATDAMLILDDGRAVVEANPAAASLFGRAADELRGEVLDRLIAEPSGSWTTMWREFLERGDVKHEHQGAGGAAPRLLECSYRARVHAGRHLCVARDVTDQRLLAERLARAARIESVGRLAGGIAHDFNNLLTAILGYTELLLSHQTDGTDREDLEEIQKAGRRAAALTQQLLAFGRKQVLRPQELDLNHTVNAIQPILRRALREDITLAVDLASAPAVVMIDASQIEQVILNLVLNSRDALPAGGAITIQVAPVQLAAADLPADHGGPAGPHVRLCVSDNGTGIPPEARPHLFEPFFTTKAQGSGTGLGLASVYGIVQQSGGFITVDTPASGGSVFSLHFPAVSPAAPALAPGPGGVETILLVENEDSVRLVIGTLLRRGGYQVIEAPTPLKALEIFSERSATIDLLLTDVVMPVMNGPALAQRCVAEKANLRVLFISGYSPAAALTGPYVAFLGKPFQAAALTQAVRDLLDRPAHGR